MFITKFREIVSDGKNTMIINDSKDNFISFFCDIVIIETLTRDKCYKKKNIFKKIRLRKSIIIGKDKDLCYIQII